MTLNTKALVVCTVASVLNLAYAVFAFLVWPDSSVKTFYMSCTLAAFVGFGFTAVARARATRQRFIL